MSNSEDFPAGAQLLVSSEHRAEDIWTKNEPLFRRLYQEQRISLAQVKEIAENEHSFPKHQLSTYEIKLRDVLKLRKKLKKEDWKPIHHYAVAHGFEPGGYDVFLNGTRIPHNKVWKEIRRNKFHFDKIIQNTRLPRDVRIQRRPTAIVSSEVIATRLNRLKSTWDRSSDAQKADDTCDALTSWDAFSAALDAMDLCPPSVEDMVHCTSQWIEGIDGRIMIKFIEQIHEDLPWNRFRRAILECLFQRKVTCECPDLDGFLFSYMPNDGFLPLKPGMLLTRLVDTIYPTSCSIYAQQLLSSFDASDRLAWHRQLANVTYCITNQPYHSVPSFDNFIVFERILRQLPPNILWSTTRKQLPCLRGVADKFINNLHRMTLAYTSFSTAKMWHSSLASDAASILCACRSLLEFILIADPEWFRGEEDHILYLCVWMGSDELVAKMIRRGGLASKMVFKRTILIVAIIEGLVDSLATLIGTFDINATSLSINYDHRYSDIDVSQFIALLEYFIVRHTFEVTTQHQYFLESLAIILELGANVDAPYPPRLLGLEATSHLQTVSDSWHISCLDVAFYLHKDAFELMAKYSLIRPGTLTRHRVCEAAMAGTVALNAYLRTLIEYPASHTYQYLQLVFLEQALLKRSPRSENLDAIRSTISVALAEFGIDFNAKEVGFDAYSTILDRCLRSVNEYGLSIQLSAILKWLSQKPITITSHMLEQCIEDNGTTILDLLEEYGILRRQDVEGLGGPALGTAALAENYKAVSWLLDRGTDINADVERGYPGMFPIGTVLSLCLRGKSHVGMCQNLVRLGAKLRCQASDQTCGRLILQTLIGDGLWVDAEFILARWHFLESFSGEVARVTVEEWKALIDEITSSSSFEHLWQLSAQLGHLFDKLLGKTAGPSGMPSLVLAIKGKRFSTAQILLASGADLEEVHGELTPLLAAIKRRHFGLARQLIELGANIDAFPPERSTDVLAFACGQNNLSASDQSGCLDLIRELLKRKGNLTNAHVGEEYGPNFRSPMLRCAKKGSLETATLLLQHQASPNLIHIRSWRSYPTQEWEFHAWTSLDCASELGRLDMTFLLLKAGALSGEPGETGYDGSIRWAMASGNRAVADLIRQHIRDLTALFKESPNLRCHHENMIEVVTAHAKDMIPLAQEQHLRWQRIEAMDRT